jgi:hypothetical protein
MIGNKVNRNPDSELISCFKHNNWRRDNKLVINKISIKKKIGILVKIPIEI